VKNLNKFLYVAERDIELLLLEELKVNPEFAGWLFELAYKASGSTPDCIGAWHSVSHPQLGESDLIVIYENNSATLIENKIDAPAQPEQADRYRLRGYDGYKDGFWRDFVTCILAPMRYLEGKKEADNYDLKISYETVRGWFKTNEVRRFGYRANVFDQAIEQNRRGYSPVVDADVTKFWELYWELVSSEFPSLETSRPQLKPARADWPEFRPSSL